MGTLERVLSQVNSQSLSPAQQSPYQVAQQPVTQLSNQSLQAQPWAYQEQQVAQTLPTNASQIQTSSPTSTAPRTSVSPVTAEVVNHFGIEAPGILNQYACSLEDLILDQAQKMDVLAARHDAMQTILTDPNHLADYTDRFFTEVVPVDIDGDTQAYQPQQAQAYQPNYDMPAPPANVGGANVGAQPQQQWEQFSDVMNRSPENAWRVLQQMGPEALRSKLLFMDPA